MYYDNALSSCVAEYPKENGFDGHFPYEPVDAVISALGSRWKYGIGNAV